MTLTNLEGLIKTNNFREKAYVPIIDRDKFGKMTWSLEKAKLDKIVDELSQNKNKISFITLQFERKTTHNQIKKRLNRITYYLITIKKIEKSRFNLVVSKTETEETMYWIIDKSEISKNKNYDNRKNKNRFRPTLY